VESCGNPVAGVIGGNFYCYLAIFGRAPRQKCGCGHVLFGWSINGDSLEIKNIGNSKGMLFVSIYDTHVVDFIIGLERTDEFQQIFIALIVA